MRLAFALLLFANIAWYGWTHWVASPDEAGATAAPAEGRVSSSRARPPREGADACRLRGSDNCLSLGPFTDLTDAARASTLLRETSSSRASAGEGVVWKDSG
jgi:hypothetical protein